MAKNGTTPRKTVRKATPAKAHKAVAPIRKATPVAPEKKNNNTAMVIASILAILLLCCLLGTIALLGFKNLQGATSATLEEVRATPAPTAEVAATCNAECEASSVVECYFAGARLPDGHVPGAERIGYAGRCDYNALTGEVSLQPYWEEVVNYDTELPIGLSVNDIQVETFELLNDGMRVISIKQNGIMSYFVADSVESPSTLPFWVNSCVKYDMTNNVMTFFHDDDAGPGGFNGGCAGTYKSYDGLPATSFSGENLFYIKAIQALEKNGYATPNQPFVVDKVWFEAWPPK